MEAQLSQLDRKAKTHKGRKHLKKFHSKVKEDPRSTLFLRATKISDKIDQVTKFLYFLKKENSQKLHKKNEIHPFENKENLIFLAEKNLCPLFCFGTHSKKRANNLIFGRIYNKDILDMFETSIKNLKGDIDNSLKLVDIIQKPVLLMQGDLFELNPDFQRMRNYFHDFFYKKYESNLVNIKNNLNFVISITGKGEKELLFRFYIREENGDMKKLNFQFDLEIKRTQLSSKSIYDKAIKERLREIKLLKQRFTKNTKMNTIGETLGRVHVRQQDIRTLRLKRMKKLKKRVVKDE